MCTQEPAADSHGEMHRCMFRNIRGDEDVEKSDSQIIAGGAEQDEEQSDAGRAPTLSQTLHLA